MERTPEQKLFGKLEECKKHKTKVIKRLWETEGKLRDKQKEVDKLKASIIMIGRENARLEALLAYFFYLDYSSKEKDKMLEEIKSVLKKNGW